MACASGMAHDLGAQGRDCLLLFVGGCVILALGFAGDVRNLRARQKLLAEILAGLLVALSGNVISAVNLPLAGLISLGDAAGLGTLLTVLWVVGLVNAFSIVDDMDGLAPGLGLLAAVSLALLAGLNGSPLALLLGLGLAGSLLALQCHNRSVVRISLGATGSMFLGYALAVVSLAGSCRTDGVVLASSTVIALGVPLFEALAAVIRGHLGGFPLFCISPGKPRHAPRKGLTPRQTAWLMCAGSLLCMVAALMGGIIPMGSANALVPVLIMLFVLGGIVTASGRVGSVISRYVYRRDTMRCMALSRYAAMRLAPKASPRETQCVLDMLALELDLLSLELRFDAGHSIVCSSGASRVPEPAPQPGGNETRFSLKAADGSPVDVSFQCMDKVCHARQDAIATCLAGAFDGLNTNIRCKPEGIAANAPLHSPARDGRGYRSAMARHTVGR